MQLKKLDQQFYADNANLVQALDNIDGNWIQGKVRGYGVVILNIHGLTFAIPLRSNIKHKAAYITVRSNQQGIKGKGLDFSKALLISNNGHISNEHFKINKSEHNRLKGKEHFITSKFEKYVQRYVEAIKKNDTNVLGSLEYRYTTLQNYHSEFKI